MIIIAGKNNIAVHGLELALQRFAPEQIAVVCNRNESGTDTWQRSLRRSAQHYGVREISLEDAYKLASRAFISLEFDRLVIPERFGTDSVFNVHFSRLPQYKGMFTSVWPLLHADAEAGVTLHRIDRGIDTGDVIAQQVFAIEPWWVCRDLYFAFNRYAGQLLDRCFSALVEGAAAGEPQAAKGASYYSKNAIDYTTLAIDPATTAWECRNKIKAFTFREYQLLTWAGRTVASATILPSKSTTKPGTVVKETADGVDITTIDYNIRLHFDQLHRMLDACERGALSEVIALAPAIAGYDDANERGWTPLIVASYAGSFEVVRWLLEQGADPGRPNHKGTTPLMYAKDAFFAGRCRHTFGLLIENGADSRAVDYAGKALADYLTAEQHAQLWDSTTA